MSSEPADVDAEGQPLEPFNDDLPDNVEVTADGLPIDIEPTDIDKEPEDFDKGPEDKFSEPGRVRRFATIMNLLNTLLGAGILGVPNSMMLIGIVPSLLLLTLVAVITHVCTVLTIKLQRRTGADGLDDLASRVLGRWGSVALSIMSMVFCISAMVSYLIINYGTIASWFSLFSDIDTSTMLARALIVFIYAICIPVLLTLPRKIGFLKYCSYVSFAGIVFYCIAIIIKGCILLPYDDAIKPKIEIAKMDISIFSSISIYGLAFALPVVILPIIDPYNKDLKRRAVVSFASIVLCYCLVSVPGVIGYLLFGDQTRSVVLENFPNDDGLMIAVRVGFFFVVSFSYPAIGQSVMASWSQLIFNTNLQGELPWKQRWIIILLTNAIPVLLAMFLPDAKPALNIGGAFGGCLVDFFYPALMWIVLSKKKWYHWQNALCILCCVFGIVAAAISTYQAIVDAIAAFSE